MSPEVWPIITYISTTNLLKSKNAAQQMNKEESVLMVLPKIIQGGMGVAVSTWELAHAVSSAGQLGVVSGTGIALVLISRLMDGDEGGHIRRALSHFPFSEVSENILKKYFIEGGRAPDMPYKRSALWTLTPSQELNQLTVVANFAEVWLAKEGHQNPVGINLLEKVQMPNLASLYGAMLAGVDYVIMGAGIPMQIPGALDCFANHQAASYPIEVHGADSNLDVRIHFDPEQVLPGIAEKVGPLKRPQFLPIVSSVVLAMALRKRANGAVNGFVIEMPAAGGHNAPPRGDVQYNDEGEPIYGKRDEVDLSKFRKMDLPFWLAGGYGHPAKYKEALNEGATGIQVGTAFAYCEESGIDPAIREQVVRKVIAEDVQVRTDPLVSPTGFPFKVVQLEDTLSDPAIYQARPRNCDLGYLRQVVQTETGTFDYRCPAEPIKAYLQKGGKLEDTEGRACLCNNLAATAGWPQVRRSGYVEQPIVTSGDDLPSIVQFLQGGRLSYSAQDVIQALIGESITN